MLRIAAICAYSRWGNTGMLSVDASLVSFLDIHVGRDRYELDIYTIEAEYEIAFAGDGSAFRYRSLQSQEQLSSYDRIVYWGDFLQSRRFYVTDLRNRFTKIGHPDYLGHLYATLLLENAPEELLRKVICFGSSLYINNHKDDTDARYIDALSRLYAHARLVLLRDPLSAQFGVRYRGEHHSASALGVDCAFLLEQSARLSWERPAVSEKANTVGYFFGRGLSKEPESRNAMNRFMRSVAKEIDSAEMTNIGWLWPDEDNSFGKLSRKLSAVNGCRLIVTDTYHLAVNSLREGVPVICIGLGAEPPARTLSEKKKELLFGMFNARESYVFIENIAEFTKSGNARKLINLHMDGTYGSAVRSNIEKSTRYARNKLLEAVL